MSQTPPNLSLSIQTIPPELMIAESSAQLFMIDSENNIVTESHFLLKPGEFTQVGIQLANRGTNTLRVRLELQIEGHFSSNWFKISPEEQWVEPGISLDASIDFQLPENFLEDPVWLAKRSSSELNYKASLCAWSISEETRQLLESTPFNFAVRPHSLYLNFLPALYSEVDFVGRFLSIFEKTFEPAVQTLENLWAYLDPLTAPKSLLPFLAAWVAWPMDSRWDLPEQRRLIKQAVELYKLRGTRQGLRLYLHLYTRLPLDDHLPEINRHISIEEVFTEGFILSDTLIGKDTVLGGGRPFHFIVRLRPESSNPIDEALVRSIIEREKPAFCTYELYIEEKSKRYFSEATVLQF